jgi:radical SAM enzyme (rSAM/lipoprotein system)
MRVDRIPLKKRLTLNLLAMKRHVDARLHDLNYLFWECTLRCNLNCIHCGSDCTRDSAAPDMPLRDFLNVCDRIRPHVNPHKTIIAITGGEPLMREDLDTCGKELYKREFPWGMVTNGYAMTTDRFHSLCESGLRSITVSIDGLEKSHDWFRGRTGSFKKAACAVEVIARTPSIIHDVATCANHRNFEELSRIRQMLIDSGVKRWRIFTVFPKGRAANNPDVMLNDSEFHELFQFIESSRIEGRIKVNYGCEGFLGDFEGRARDNLFSCTAGISTASVLADGSISACPSLRGDYIQGNIYKDDFWDVWNGKFQIMRNRSWMKTGECASCKVYKWCRGNGLHLREQKTGRLLLCHYNRLRQYEKEMQQTPVKR